MSFRNPPVPWSELERRLSDDPLGRGPWIEPTPGDGGDSPAWSRKRAPYVPPPGLGAGGGSTPYAELHCHTNFSFLDGASHPEELVEEAVRLGLEALAVTDHDGCYGVVRFAEAARAAGPAHRVRLRADPRPHRAGGGRGRPRGRPGAARDSIRGAAPAGAGPRPAGLRQPGPGGQPGPDAGGEGGAPHVAGRAGRPRRPRRPPLAGAHRLSQGSGARRPDRGRAGGGRPRAGPPGRGVRPRPRGRRAVGPR